MNGVILDMKAQDLANNNLPQSAASSEEYLFNASMLKSIRPAEFKFTYDKFDQSSESGVVDLGDGLVLRPLRRDDYERGYMQLLSQLTEVGQVSRELFEKRFDSMKACPGTYYICVVEDVNKSKVIASLTLVYEQKFIREASARGRVEDMVVDEQCRGKKLSKLLLDVICQMCQLVGCYKVSLECKDHLRNHYSQFGFLLEPGQNYMCQRFVH